MTQEEYTGDEATVVTTPVVSIIVYMPEIQRVFTQVLIEEVPNGKSAFDHSKDRIRVGSVDVETCLTYGTKIIPTLQLFGFD